jgi:RNA polymerase sigma factor (sigma-70 family)
MPRPDPSKLASWYAAHAAPLVLYARQWGGPAAAEDAVQEAFIQLLSQSREPDNVRAWLFKTVRNAALSQLRSSQRRDRRERAVTAARPEWFTPRPDDLIDAAAAQDALAALDADQREVVVLRIWGQASFAEIAEVTGSPLSSVYDRYKSGLASLKQRMESSCVNKKKKK